MSDLQIGLISLGIVLIVLVLLFNWWQDWRVRRSMQEHFPEAEHDVLMTGAGTRKEPGLFVPGTGAIDETAEVDPSCEAVIDIAFGHPVAGSDLFEAVRSIHRVGKKPVRVFAVSDRDVHRSVLCEDELYASLQLAVVIANRSGALTAIEWSHLWTLAQNLAERFDGVIEAPDQEELLARAHDLDTRCAAMDAQVGLIVQLVSPKPRKQIEAVAAEAGFVEYGGQLAWMAENGLPRFMLQFDASGEGQGDEAVHRVDLVLDVPNSVPDDQAFSRMAAVGQDLAARLDAHLLDDQGRSLPEGATEPIDRQISDMYDRLDQAGFLAGTERAARVFS